MDCRKWGAKAGSIQSVSRYYIWSSLRTVKMFTAQFLPGTWNNDPDTSASALNPNVPLFFAEPFVIVG
jgi:hypothetical protein